MKKATHKSKEQQIQAEYDFSGGVRGKYARRYAQGTNVVVLDPDVAKDFPNSKAVNRSLRTLAALQHQKNRKLTTKKQRRATAPKRRCRLADLVVGITPKNLHSATDWGQTTGKEILE